MRSIIDWFRKPAGTGRTLRFFQDEVTRLERRLKDAEARFEGMQTAALETSGRSSELEGELRAIREKRTRHCSFCGRSQHKVLKLIAWFQVLLCGECVFLCCDRPGEDARLLSEAIQRHREAVEADEASFDADGTSKSPQAAEATGKAEIDAFRALVSFQCTSSEMVQSKIRYLTTGSVGERESLIDCLTSEPYLGGSGCSLILHSLLLPAPPAGGQ